MYDLKMSHEGEGLARALRLDATFADATLLGANTSVRSVILLLPKKSSTKRSGWILIRQFRTWIAVNSIMQLAPSDSPSKT